MNCIERWVDRQLRKFAWKSMRLRREYTHKDIERQICKYRWIIKSEELGILYDTEKDGYEGLKDFPVIFQALETIQQAEKDNVKRSNVVGKRKVIFTFDPQLLSIFPNERLEKNIVGA